MSDRDEQVRRLAKALDEGAAFNRNYAASIASALYNAGARMPDPPAPVNPISEATARLVWSGNATDTSNGPTVLAIRRSLWQHAAAIVRDLATAKAKDTGFVRLEFGGTYHFTPERIVDALTGPDK